MKNKEVIVSDETPIITVEWLNSLKVAVILSKESFDFFIEDNELEDEEIAFDWDEAGGSASYIEKNGKKRPQKVRKSAFFKD